jgi:hypothetical protein
VNEQPSDHEHGALDRDIAALLTDPTVWAEPSADLEGRVVAAIGTGRSAAPDPLDAHAAAPVVVAQTQSPWRGRFLSAIVGAAAAALVVFVLAARDDSAGNDSGVALGQFELTGTDLAPGVSGRATVRQFAPGAEITFAVPGLPRRDGDEFYQGWVKRCDGTGLVSIGTFHDLSAVEGWAGVDMAEFPIVTVTRERVAAPTDAEQGSSGEMVVVGNLRPCPDE